MTDPRLTTGAELDADHGGLRRRWRAVEPLMDRAGWRCTAIDDRGPPTSVPSDQLGGIAVVTGAASAPGRTAP